MKCPNIQVKVFHTLGDIRKSLNVGLEAEPTVFLKVNTTLNRSSKIFAALAHSYKSPLKNTNNQKLL
jgi:hypothetical protein